jgi:hypothetical protein
MGLNSNGRLLALPTNIRLGWVEVNGSGKHAEHVSIVILSSVILMSIIVLTVILTTVILLNIIILSGILLNGILPMQKCKLHQKRFLHFAKITFLASNFHEKLDLTTIYQLKLSICDIRER